MRNCSSSSRRSSSTPIAAYRAPVSSCARSSSRSSTASGSSSAMMARPTSRRRRSRSSSTVRAYRAATRQESGHRPVVRTADLAATCQWPASSAAHSTGHSHRPPQRGQSGSAGGMTGGIGASGHVGPMNRRAREPSRRQAGWSERVAMGGIRHRPARPASRIGPSSGARPTTVRTTDPTAAEPG